MVRRRFFWGGPIRCTIVSRYVQHFFPRKAKIFSRGLVPPIVTVLFSRTNKELCAFAIRMQFYWAEHKRYSSGPLSPSCHIKFNQKRFGIEKFAVNIHWMYTLIIYFLQMYENMPCYSIVQFSGLIFEITFRFDSPSNIYTQDLLSINW